MAQEVKKLTDAKIKALLNEGKPGLTNDGGGLYLRIGRGGTASWVHKHERGGKVRELGLGSYPAVPLAAVRGKAAELRQQIAAGDAPLSKREQVKNGAKGGLSLEEVAKQYIRVHETSWKNPVHRQQWHSTLRDYVFPVIGSRPIVEIDVEDIQRVLDQIWHTIPESASRIRGRLESILDFAAAKKLRGPDNPASWRRLRHLYPAKAKIAPVEHHPAMPHTEVPAFMRKLEASGALSALALRFLVYTACRSMEIRGGRWSEIDMAAKTWTIPASRMKAGRPHAVPLSDGALEVLHAVLPLKGGDERALLFPGFSRQGGKPLSDVSLSKLLPPGVTAHGFRASFRTWAGEYTNAQREVIELCLAHTVGNQVEQSYARTTLLEKRRTVMGEWSSYLAATVDEQAAAE